MGVYFKGGIQLKNIRNARITMIPSQKDGVASPAMEKTRTE